MSQPPLPRDGSPRCCRAGTLSPGRIRARRMPSRVIAVARLLAAALCGAACSSVHALTTSYDASEIGYSCDVIDTSALRRWGPPLSRPTIEPTTRHEGSESTLRCDLEFGHLQDRGSPHIKRKGRGEDVGQRR